MHKGVGILLAISLGCSSPAMAGAGGGQHHGAHSGGAGQHGNAGGMAPAHMSEQGTDNTNAQWSGGTKKGHDRSDVRGGDHQGHGQNQGQHHGKGKGKGHGHGEHQ